MYMQILFGPNPLLSLSTKVYVGFKVIEGQSNVTKVNLLEQQIKKLFSIPWRVVSVAYLMPKMLQAN